MTRPRLGRPTRTTSLIAGAVLLLSGCGLHPGAAAVVGDTTISDDQVDEAAAALCAANLAGAAAQGQPRPELATRGARQASLSLLIDSELSHQFGEANGIEPSQAEVSRAVAQNQQTVDALPQDQREGFLTLFRTYVEGQVIVQQAGEQAVGAAAAPEEVRTAGIQQRNEWLTEQGIEVELDPRYGEYADGGVAGSSGSLSVPASDGAVAGNSTEPSPDWVSDLPLTQKCG